MATYKNTDDLLEIIVDWQKTLLPIEEKGDKVIFNVLETVNDYIHDLDTDDVEEVVRCKDCKHYSKNIFGSGSVCQYWQTWYQMDGNAYCSFGEKVE